MGLGMGVGVGSGPSSEGSSMGVILGEGRAFGVSSSVGAGTAGILEGP